MFLYYAMKSNDNKTIDLCFVGRVGGEIVVFFF